MLRTIDFGEDVPANAVAVTVDWMFQDEKGAAFLLRSTTDPNPVHLFSQSGRVVVHLEEPKALWLQILDGSSPLDVKVTGVLLP